MQQHGTHKRPTHSMRAGADFCVRLPMPDDYVSSTVLALKELNPDYIIPMHCTGTPFHEMAEQEMPGRVRLSSTGTRFVFCG